MFILLWAFQLFYLLTIIKSLMFLDKFSLLFLFRSIAFTMLLGGNEDRLVDGKSKKQTKLVLKILYYFVLLYTLYNIRILSYL